MGRGKKRTEAISSPLKPASAAPKKLKRSASDDAELSFIGAPVPSGDAKTRWPHRYQSKVKFNKINRTIILCASAFKILYFIE